jgi:hypothetical protein
VNIYLAASLLLSFAGRYGHVWWMVVGDVRGANAICAITRHGRDLWANGCFRP